MAPMTLTTNYFSEYFTDIFLRLFSFKQAFNFQAIKFLHFPYKQNCFNFTLKTKKLSINNKVIKH